MEPQINSDLYINDSTSTIMFLHSTTKILYQCFISCMYNLGKVTPKIFNSLSIKSILPKVSVSTPLYCFKGYQITRVSIQIIIRLRIIG